MKRHEPNEYGWCDRCGDHPTSANGDNAYPFLFDRECRKPTKRSDEHLGERQNVPLGSDSDCELLSLATRLADLAKGRR